jgi:predicted RNA binding protein YcfA (HicA-like mRNA interferase family)
VIRRVACDDTGASAPRSITQNLIFAFGPASYSPRPSAPTPPAPPQRLPFTTPSTHPATGAGPIIADLSSSLRLGSGVLSDRRDLLAWRILSYPLRNVRGVKPARVWRGDITNVSFDDLVRLVQALGFREVGGRGSHRVFGHPNVPELVNLQVERGQAKRYQVRQVASLVRRYDLPLEDE